MRAIYSFEPCNIFSCVAIQILPLLVSQAEPWLGWKCYGTGWKKKVVHIAAGAGLRPAEHRTS